jgi:hypothetical protein
MLEDKDLFGDCQMSTDVDQTVSQVASKVNASDFDAAAAYLKYKGVSEVASALAVLENMTAEQRLAFSQCIVALQRSEYVKVTDAHKTLAVYSDSQLRDYIARVTIGSDFITAFKHNVSTDLARIGVKYVVPEKADAKPYLDLGSGCYGSYDGAFFKPALLYVRYCKLLKIPNFSYTGDLLQLIRIRCISLRAKVQQTGVCSMHAPPPKTSLPHGILHYADASFVSNVRKHVESFNDNFEKTKRGVGYILSLYDFNNRDTVRADAVKISMEGACKDLLADARSAKAIIPRVLEVVNARNQYIQHLYGVADTMLHFPTLSLVAAKRRFQLYIEKLKIKLVYDTTESTFDKIMNSSLDFSGISSLVGSAVEKKEENIAFRFALCEPIKHTVFSRIATYLLTVQYLFAKLQVAENNLNTDYVVIFSLKEAEGWYKNDELLERKIAPTVALRAYTAHTDHAYQINTCSYSYKSKNSDELFAASYSAKLCDSLKSETTAMADHDFKF